VKFSEAVRGQVFGRFPGIVLISITLPLDQIFMHDWNAAGALESPKDRTFH
jgi:hypothetical protein